MKTITNWGNRMARLKEVHVRTTLRPGSGLVVAEEEEKEKEELMGCNGGFFEVWGCAIE